MKKIIALRIAIVAILFLIVFMTPKGIKKKVRIDYPRATVGKMIDQIIDEDVQEEANANPEVFLKNISN